MKANKISFHLSVLGGRHLYLKRLRRGGTETIPHTHRLGGRSERRTDERQAFLKDSAGNPEMSTTINAQSGAFSFNVSGKTPPYMLRAGTLYSMSNGPGTANINPFSHLMVADAADFTDMASMNAFYNNPDGTQMGTISGNIGTARQQMQQTMAPLLDAYGVATVDPITGAIIIGQGMDRMFDDVKMTIDASGNVSMMYVDGTPVYTGPMANMSIRHDDVGTLSLHRLRHRLAA